MKRQSSFSLLLIVFVVTLVLSACAPMAYRPSDSSHAAAPASESAAASGDAAAAPAAGGEAGYAPASPTYGDAARPAPNRNQPAEPVTAGVTDDNANWLDYLAYLDRNWHSNVIAMDVSERYIIQVVDEVGHGVHDATVEIYSGETSFFSGRTDTSGRLFFHPLALTADYQHQWRQFAQRAEVRVVASKGFVAQSAIFHRGQSEQWTVTLTDPARTDYAQLDLLFLVDATGSMGDEIDKLKASMADIADQIGRLPAAPDVRYGLVAFRDQGDAFVVRTDDFTPDLWSFQRSLAALRAEGGGDEPEALNEALHRSLYDLSWRTDDTVRLVILVGDAPPHLDYGWENFNYATDLIEAVRQGIKIYPVGASNLSPDGEYVFRQLAQFTGGKFVFLTYAEGSDPSSGPGTETDHDVDNYSVDTLDRLVVRLVSEELAQLQGNVGLAQPTQQQPVPTPTPLPVLQPLSCTVDFVANWTDCDQGENMEVLERTYNAALIGLTLTGPQRHGYTRARFEITFDRNTANIDRDTLVNIGDAAGAEVVVSDGALALYGTAQLPAQSALDGKRLVRQVDDVVHRGETIALEIANDRLGINYAGGIDVVESPYLFTLDQPAGNMLYAAFNRTLSESGGGTGVSKVVITLYPAR